MSESDRALSALNTLDAGCNREQWVRLGMAAKAAGLSLDDFTAWSSHGANYAGERDCADAWRSFDDGPVQAGTLYHMALSAGWQDSTSQPRQRAASAQKTPPPTPHPRQREKVAQRASAEPLALWEQCHPADAVHAYIVTKQGVPDGLRVVPPGNSLTIAGQCVTGWLVVPARSLTTGELRTLQLIPPPGQGKKLNMPEASFDDGLFMVGDAAKSARLFVVEGIGQAWACWKATGCAAVVCFGAGRMATVAKCLRDTYATLSLVLVPDRGKEHQADAIARAVHGEWVELPPNKPANYDANDYAAEHGSEALAVQLSRSSTPALRYKLRTAAELVDTPPLRWLVRGVLPTEGIAAMFGVSASGKSFLALDLGSAIAYGAAWFNCKVTQAPVVYLALEGEAGLSQRLRAWQLHHDSGLPAALKFITQPFDLREPKDIAELVHAVKLTGSAGGLLIIDTLNRAASGADENSSQDMGCIIDAAKALQAELGGLVLLIHHAGKDQSKGLRGHSSLFAALDAAIEVKRNGNWREWSLAKAKDGSDGECRSFELQTIEIDQYDDGEVITSCAVAPAEPGQQTTRRTLTPKSSNQRAIWKALEELFKNAEVNRTRPEDAPRDIPIGQPAVRLDEAISATRIALVCEPKRRTERTRVAIDGLIAQGLLVHREDWIWRA